ncbi:MAG: hypothetical protein R3C52_15565 [Hyphomonadaceae bacterium]
MKSVHRTVASAALVASVALAGCSTSSPTYNPVLPFDPGEAHIASFNVNGDAVAGKAVALNAPADYSNVALSNPAIYAPGVSPVAAGVGGALGVLLVSAIAAGIESARNERINNFLYAQGFDAKKVFYDALRKELGAEGYAMNVDGEGAAAADAGLEVSILQYGYQLAPVGSGWAPVAVANVTAKSSAGDVLMKDTVVVSARGAVPVLAPGGSGVGGDALRMPVGDDLMFANVDEIVEGDPARSVEALTYALEATAAGVARLLHNGGIEQAAAGTAETGPAGAPTVGGAQ